MKNFAFFNTIYCSGLLILCGCAEQPVKKIINSTNQQHVIFSVQIFTTGGGGDPVFDEAGEVSINGVPVLVMTDKDQSMIYASAGKDSKNNTNKIRVEARIHLEPATAHISTDPPTTESVLRLVIDELIKAEWQTKPY